MSKKCYILVGLPGSGKTTYAHQLAENLWRASSDDYIDTWAEELNTTYDAIWDISKDLAEKFFWKDLEDGVRAGYNIIVDRTNLTVKSRNRVMQHVKNIDSDYNFICVVFRVEADLHRRYLNRDGKTISNEVLDKMKMRYQPPTADEKFHETIHIYKVSDKNDNMD